MSKERTEQVAHAHPDWTNKQIADHLNISLRTVYRHLGRQSDRLKTDSDEQQTEILNKNDAKILVFDIETSPLICCSWGLYKQMITPSQVIRDMSILTWAAKWLNSPKVFSSRVSAEEAKVGSDDSILERLWSLIDRADIVVGFNNKKFDHKKLNSRFLIGGYAEPSPYTPLDIFVEIKKKFSFSSNKLDYINQLLGIGRKLETSMDLWMRCVNGDDRALKEMEVYNKQDCLVTEELYHAVKSWIKSPNLGLYTPTLEEVCPTCGGINLEPNGYYTTPVSKYESLRCVDCKSLSRRRVNAMDKDIKKRQLVSL